MEFAEEVLIPIIAIISFFSSIIIFVYMFFTYRSRIRMALIERDKDASIFRKTQDRSIALRNGIVAVMSGVGLILGYVLEMAGFPGFVAYLGMVLIFGGLGLISYYWYVSRQETSEELL